MNCTQFFSFKLGCWPRGRRHCEVGSLSGPTLGPSSVTHMDVKRSVAPACSQGQPGVTIVSAAEIANDSRHTERSSQHRAGWTQALSTGDPALLPSLLPAARGSPHSRHTPAPGPLHGRLQHYLGYFSISSAWASLSLLSLAPPFRPCRLTQHPPMRTGSGKARVFAACVPPALGSSPWHRVTLCN